MNDILFNKITELIEAGENSRALGFVTRRIESNPDNAYLYYLAGIVYRSANMLDKAIENYSIATKLDPQGEYILLALGIAQQLNGQLEHAVQTLKKAIQINPDLPESYNSLGMTYKKLGKLLNAQHWYDEGLQCLVRLASAQARRENPSVASRTVGNSVFFNPQLLEESHKILKSTPQYTIMSNNLGVCLAELGDIEGAKNAYRESIEFTPEGYDYPFPIINLSQLEDL